MSAAMPVREDLLRQAAEKEAMAATFDQHARNLADVFTGIPITPGGSDAVWRGQAADRCTAQARQLHHEISDLRESCTATARNLRRRAQQLREEAARAAPAGA